MNPTSLQLASTRVNEACVLIGGRRLAIFEPSSIGLSYGHSVCFPCLLACFFSMDGWALLLHAHESPTNTLSKICTGELTYLYLTTSSVPTKPTSCFFTPCHASLISPPPHTVPRFVRIIHLQASKHPLPSPLPLTSSTAAASA